MSRLWLVLLPLAAVTGVVLGEAMPVPAAVAVGLVVGVAAAVLVWRRELRLVRRLADQVNTWLGKRQHDPVQLEAGTHWRELAVAVNALGAAYDRRGERLRRERPWRRSLVDALIEPALLFSAEGQLVAANDAARTALRVPGPERTLTIVQALGSAALAGAAREAMAAGRRVDVEATVGGRELRAAASPIGDELLVVVTDVSEQRRVDQLRRNFVANASHELKTPVTSLQALAEALEVTIERDPQRARQLVSRLGEESARLVRLVHDLLDLRRLEDHDTAEPEPVELVGLVREVVAELIDRAARHEVELRVDLPEQAYVAGLPADLRLAIRNLVDNAISYNRPGGTVDVQVVRGAGTHQVVVADTGIGIARSDLPRVFERFYRVDVGRSRERGGTGLGLAIVRHAVERHGGTVRVESLLGEGSTFTIVLPVRSPE